MNRRTVCLTAVFGTLSPPPVFAQEGKVTVFAAASMKDALDEINAAFTKSTGIKVDASYEGSQTLVQLMKKVAGQTCFSPLTPIGWITAYKRRLSRLIVVFFY